MTVFWVFWLADLPLSCRSLLLGTNLFADWCVTVEAVDCCDESDAIPQIEIFIIPRATLK